MFAELKKIYVSEYKNLVNCHLEIRDFVVLVGSNNSGKSNFVEIFDILGNIFYGGEYGRKEAAKKMLFWLKPTTVKLEFEVIKNNKRIKAEYQIQITLENFENKFDIKINNEYFSYKSPSSTGKPNLLFSRKNGRLRLREKNGRLEKSRPINSQIPVFHVLKSLYPEAIDLPDEYNFLIPLLSFISPIMFTAHKLPESYNSTVKSLFQNLYKLQENKDVNYEKFKNSFIEILEFENIYFHEQIIPEIKTQDPVYFCAIIEKNKKEPRLIEFMSDGTKILFLMLYNIFIGNNPLICIEEPEIGLHPKALSKFLKLLFIKDVSFQAIITTHSPYLLTLVNPENVFYLERNENGLYSFKKVSTIKNLKNRLKSKYVNFGDLFVDNFETHIDTTLD